MDDAEGPALAELVDAFQDAHLGQYFGTSVFVTALAMVLCLIVALPCSYVMARFDFPGKKILKIAIQGGLFINVNYISSRSS